MANQDFGSPSDAPSEAATSFRDVASRVQEKASELGQRASEFGQQAVGAIDARRDTVRDMFSDLEGYIKEHPTQALLGAVVMGFFVGRTMRRG